jgi:hypothetical protein
MLLEIEIHALRYGHCGVGIGGAVVQGIKVDYLPVLPNRVRKND